MNYIPLNISEYKSYLINNNSSINVKDINLSFQKIKIQNIFYKNFNEISIIIYSNEFKYLMKTVNSLLNQIFVKIEIIIIYDNTDKNELNYIKNVIKNYKIIKLIDNKKKKGLIYSLSIGVLSSAGKYILFLKSSYILSKENILYLLFKNIDNDLDILEFNLLIDNKIDEHYDFRNINIYKCPHIESEIKLDSLKNTNFLLDIDQEKDLLFNKLIKNDLFKEIIKKYKFIDYRDVIYNYYDNIFLFSLFKEKLKFKHIDMIGVIKIINNTNNLKIMGDKNQKKKDSIFYINFLFENTRNTYEDKHYVLNEFYNIFNIIYNKIEYNLISKYSFSLLQKFNDSKFINISEKNNLIFLYRSFIS